MNRHRKPQRRMSNSALQLWLERLEKLHPTEIELGLARITQVAQNLELLPLPQKVVTVAGTNGKGSTVAALEALLTTLGLRCGTFTSPHLLRFNERIRVGQQEATDTDIVRAFEAIEAARGEISLTYFEFAALAALLVFRQHAPDVVILEVGLGGRLDAVNIVDPDVCVITSIDLDHQGWLGETRDEIACEKAGILREGVPVVVADPEPPASLDVAVAQIGASPALYLGKQFRVEPAAQGKWQAAIQGVQGSEILTPAMVQGSLLPQNIAAALQAAALCGFTFSGEQIQAALGSLVVPGRRQYCEREGIHYVLDVAHNPAAVVSLFEYLQSGFCNGRKIAVFSAMQDKDLSTMLAMAVPHVDAWMLADQPRNGRAATASHVMSVLNDLDVAMISCSKNLRQALARAQQLAAPGDTIVVFGSFTTVAAVLPKFLDGKQERLQSPHTNTMQEAG